MNAILVWRFMLNLQATRYQTADLTTIVGTQQTSTIYFDRVIGSIGDSIVVDVPDTESQKVEE